MLEDAPGAQHKCNFILFVHGSTKIPIIDTFDAVLRPFLVHGSHFPPVVTDFVCSCPRQEVGAQQTCVLGIVLRSVVAVHRSTAIVLGWGKKTSVSVLKPISKF